MLQILSSTENNPETQIIAIEQVINKSVISAIKYNNSTLDKNNQVNGSYAIVYIYKRTYNPLVMELIYPFHNLKNKIFFLLDIINVI